MKLKEYAGYIAALAKKYPDLECVYSSDGEGNSYQELIWAPEPCLFDFEEMCPEYIDKQSNKNKKPNAIIIN
jgi:hypothetical protein